MPDDLFMGDLPFEQNGHRYSRGGTVHVIVYGDEEHAMATDVFSCGRCGSYPSIAVKDRVARAKTICSVPPEGITSVWTLQVPSGKLVVANDLRDVYEVDADAESEFASYNSALGQHQYFLAMAELGCSYGYVGNSCPSMYRTGSDSFVIGTPGYREDDDDDDGVMPGAIEIVASITTDLWAYCIADADDWRAKGGTDERLVEFVDVTPGTYEFTHHTGEASFVYDRYETPTIYTHIKRVEQS